METTKPADSPETVSTARPRRGPTVETILYLVILALAVASRFALLDSQAMHLDEGTHAYLGWQIYQGTTWKHDAVYHGPFIYHSGALGFLLFGDSDSTARLSEVLFSIGTVMLPWFLRRYLGRWGALAASTLLLLSPTFLYFGRFARNDVFGGFWTLLTFVCIVRYLGERRNGWLYGAAAATCLHFCTKETAYIATAVFLLFLGGRLLWKRYGLHALWPLLGLLPAAAEDLWKALAQGTFPLPQIVLRGSFSLSLFSLVPLVLAGLALLALLAWHWGEAVRRRMSNPTLDLVVTLGTMMLPLLSAIPLNLFARLRGLSPIDYHSPDIPPEVVLPAAAAIGVMFLLSAAIGLAWDARRWGVVAGIFWGTFFLLYTSFFTSMTGGVTGTTQALGFWLSQQEVKRIHVGPQYYFLMMPIYEAVSLLFGTLGVGYLAWRELFRRRGGPTEPAEHSSPPTPPLAAPPSVAIGLLTFWAPVGFALYTLAGEQAPWLNIHPTLPFTLLAGTLIGQVIAYRPPEPDARPLRRWADLAMLATAAALLVWAGRSFFRDSVLEGGLWFLAAAILLGLAGAALFLTDGDRPGEASFYFLGITALLAAILGANSISYQEAYSEWPLYVYVPLGVLALAILTRSVLLGKAALRSAALLLFAFFCLYSLGSAISVTYVNNDTPVEMLVYVQGSSDLQWTAGQIEALSTLLTGEKDLVFLYDGETSWPLVWYLRDYPRKIYQPTISGPPSADVALALVYRDAKYESISAPYLESRFAPTRYYALNWWFPFEGSYSAAQFVNWLGPEWLSENATGEVNWAQVLQALSRPAGQARAWRYLIFRDPPSPLGAREYAVYIRRDLVWPLVLLQDALPRK